MSKVIFLDVDGVLNIYSESYKTNSVEYDGYFSDTINRMEFHLVKRLEYIISQTNANIVLNTGWCMVDVIRILEEYNFKYIEKIESAIPKAGNWIYFILEYVEKYEVDRFYVIDDEILIENVDKLIQNKKDKIPFFGTKIDCSCGLSDENAKFIIKYLNEN